MLHDMMRCKLHEARWLEDSSPEDNRFVAKIICFFQYLETILCFFRSTPYNHLHSTTLDLVDDFQLDRSPNLDQFRLVRNYGTSPCFLGAVPLSPSF